MKELRPDPSLSAIRWTLFEMFVLVTLAAGALSFASVGAPRLGVCLFATALSLRTATVDFSLAGDVACGLVLVFGIPMLFFAMLLMIT